MLLGKTNDNRIMGNSCAHFGKQITRLRRAVSISNLKRLKWGECIAPHCQNLKIIAVGFAFFIGDGLVTGEVTGEVTGQNPCCVRW